MRKTELNYSAKNSKDFLFFSYKLSEMQMSLSHSLIKKKETNYCTFYNSVRFLSSAKLLKLKHYWIPVFE